MPILVGAINIKYPILKDVMNNIESCMDGGWTTLDNDGNALIDGTAYFNTTDNVLMVYDLGNTTWKRTTPTTAD